MQKFQQCAYAVLAIGLISVSVLGKAQAVGTPIKGGQCFGTPQTLQCDYLGKVTIKEIYEKGWRVISYVKEGANSVSVVIEEQR